MDNQEKAEKPINRLCPRYYEDSRCDSGKPGDRVQCKACGEKLVLTEIHGSPEHLWRRVPYCCFIPNDQQEAAKEGKLVPGCGNDAEWNIHCQSEGPDMATQSCTEHVGEMLGNGMHDVWPV